MKGKEPPMKLLSCFLVMSLLLFSFDLPNEDPDSVDFNTNPSGKERIAVVNSAYENELIALINNYRKSKGLNELIAHPDLMRACRYHAADMGHEDYFEHATYNRVHSQLKRGVSTFKRIKMFYSGFANTENCGAGYQSPEDVFKGWINSSGHYANLLNKSSTHIGVGFYQTNHSKYKRYWVFESAVE